MSVVGGFAEVVGAHLDEPDDKIAAELLRAHRPVVVAVLVDAIGAYRRVHDRAAEQASVSAFVKRGQKVVDLAGWRALAKIPISTGDGSGVWWGTATVEQHQQRVAMLSRMRDGIAATIDRHAQAIALISAQPGATCLNDILERSA